MGISVLRIKLLLTHYCLLIFELILPFGGASTLLQNFHGVSCTTQGSQILSRCPVTRIESVDTGPVYPSSALEVIECLSNIFPFLKYQQVQLCLSTFQSSHWIESGIISWVYLIMEYKPSSLGPTNGLSQVDFSQFLFLLTLSYRFPFLHKSANFYCLWPFGLYRQTDWCFLF